VSIRIEQVTTPALALQWLDLPRTLYSADPVWVCPLDEEIAKVFDPKKNLAFTHGEAARWLALDAQGKAVG
jgi:hypothetical protein